MINLNKITYKIICESEDGSDNSGTGFLVSKNKIITAYHVVEDCDVIKIYNETQYICNATISHNINEKFKCLDVAILNLDKNIDFNNNDVFLVKNINPGTKWKTRGYPAPKSAGDNILYHDDNIVNQVLDRLKNNKINVELEHQKKYGSYKGFSGAPLVVEDRIVGIIVTESTEQGKSYELNALLLNEIEELLKLEEISFNKIDSLPIIEFDYQLNCSFVDSMNSELTPLIRSIIPVYKPWRKSKVDNKKIVNLKDKLLYNEVNHMAKRYIDQSSYMSLVESVIDEIDSNEPESRAIFLWAINEAYIESKEFLFKEYDINSLDEVSSLNCIRQNTSKVIEFIFNKFKNNLDIREVESKEKLSSVIHLIICYGIINCKVFERPNNYKGS
ncbi:trypsin-like serine protease [Photobacterium leiognathi]|uniref:trypsin-like serine protease n=1 Tax=Photobacterium leiognathi TaxID=553611 RepID=UPI0027349EDC|nr:trypsin-like serine protease [Photobacterium leiognathi]